MTTLVICSGGLDSVTLAYQVAAEGRLGRLITYDYGQRHRREIDSAHAAAVALGVRQEVVDLSPVTRLLAGSVLTDPTAGDVPEGHYAEETMRATVVPNRNAIMLTVAFGAAAGLGMTRVAAAFHGGDHFVYPDCRPAFVEAFRTMQARAMEEIWEIDLEAPFVEKTKADIVAIGAELGVPFAETWSCYRGGNRHCGRCGTCVERAEAFYLAGVADPTDYADPDYWIEACHIRDRSPTGS